MRLALISVAPGRVQVRRAGTASPRHAVTLLEPGGAHEEIPYEAWEARLGEEVEVEAYRQLLMKDGTNALTPHWPAEPATPDWPVVQACPRCGDALVPGRLRIETTTFGVLMAGASYQHLFFHADGGNKGVVALHQGSSARAGRCPTCHGVWIEDAAAG